MAVAGECIEISELAERDVDHQIILSLSSIKSILPDGLSCLECLSPGSGRDPKTKETIMDDQAKCPFSGGKPAPTNRDWWPKGLNIEGLHKNSDLSDPMGKDFDYAK